MPGNTPGHFFGTGKRFRRRRKRIDKPTGFVYNKYDFSFRIGVSPDRETQSAEPFRIKKENAMKAMKRVLPLCFLLAALTLLLCACDSSGSGTPADTSKGETDSGKQVDIIKNQTSAFRLVRPDTNDYDDGAGNAMRRLRKSFLSATGYDMEMTTDFTKGEEQKAEAEAAYEILVGPVKREVMSALPDDLGNDEYLIMMQGKKIILYASVDYGYEYLVDYFLKTYLGYDPETDTYAKTDLSLPENLICRGKFPVPTTIYVLSEISSLGKGDNGKNLNDIIRLIVSLQGRINQDYEKNHFLLYFSLPDSKDEFWLDYIRGEGKTFANTVVERIGDWGTFWKLFGSYVKEAGTVVWDDDVPATANVAATICGVDGYLPVMWSSDPDSLYAFLKSEGVPIKMDLVGMFTGYGTIPDTDIPTTGSTKCDAYLWALETYMDRCSSDKLAYVLDGASTVPTNQMYIDFKNARGWAPTPTWNQIYSHDFFIYNKCFFFDLTCETFEAPCDDPEQKPGTDAETLKKILLRIRTRNQGEFTKLFGFPPWYMKYTTTLNHSSRSVNLEWDFVDLISSYNVVKEADAAHPAWMTNASVYCLYQPSLTEFKNNKTVDTAYEFDEHTRYFTIYMGDYDSSAWLKERIPEFFTDKTRGKYPLMWGFNPNLSDRAPMIFDYIFENLTPNDYIVAGDSGAGYVSPACVGSLSKWVNYNEPYMSRFDMDIVGFIINTTHPMTPKIFEAYSEIAPVGSFHNDSGQRLVIYNDETVYIHLMNGINTDAEGVEDVMYNYMIGSKESNFAGFRTVVKSPASVNAAIDKFLDYANGKNDGYVYEYVDPFTLMKLALESGMGKHVYN